MGTAVLPRHAAPSAGQDRSYRSGSRQATGLPMACQRQLSPSYRRPVRRGRTTVKRHRTSAALRCTHFGTWRALAALPAITGSVLLLILLLGGLGRWEGPALLAWMAAGLLALTRTWERVVLQFVCRVLALTAYEAAALEPIRLAVLNRCGLEPDRIDVCIADLPGKRDAPACPRHVHRAGPCRRSRGCRVLRETVEERAAVSRG